MTRFDLTALEPEYRTAAEQIWSVLGAEEASGLKLTGTVREKGLSLLRTEEGWQIGCADRISFVRALSMLSQFRDEKVGFFHEETPKLTSLGVMADCSRGAVPTVKAVKKMVAHLALMGFTCVQLYTEDTFEIPDQPYFGYLRGRYTRQELKEMDDYAWSVGVELVPCIQTLAHLLPIFRWADYADIHDTDDILLCGEEKTYGLIESMFRVCAECFRSRRINIGMDEAHMLGLGRYLDKHGYQNRPEIMLEHLNRVVEIARKYGFAPMMWSDMFFRLANGGEYYAFDKPIDRTVVEKIPKDLSLVYWDYYSAKEETYVSMIRRHQEFGCGLVFAGGAWKWGGFTPENTQSIRLASTASAACKKTGVKDVLITCWGDNGAEASMFSVLPALGCWAESCWANDGAEWRKDRFRACCGCEYDDFMHLEDGLYMPNDPDAGKLGMNPTKYLLYQDPMLGVIDCRSYGKAEEEHFARCAENLERAAVACRPFYEVLDGQAKLCNVLARKVTFGGKLRSAYDRGDREALKEIADSAVPELIGRMEEFIRAYHSQWLAENKPFGLEIFDLRLGGLIQRLRTCQEEIRSYLAGEIQEISELEEKLLPFQAGCRGANSYYHVYWDWVASPGSITGV